MLWVWLIMGLTLASKAFNQTPSISIVQRNHSHPTLRCPHRNTTNHSDLCKTHSCPLYSSQQLSERYCSARLPQALDLLPSSLYWQERDCDASAPQCKHIRVTFYLSSGGNGLCRGMLVLSISSSSAGVYIVRTCHFPFPYGPDQLCSSLYVLWVCVQIAAADSILATFKLSVLSTISTFTRSPWLQFWRIPCALYFLFF